MRSRHALESTIRAMSARHEKLFMWTFTLPVLLSLPIARRLWSKLSKRLVSYVGFNGVRVFELHETHGLHIHCLAVSRYDVRQVRAICRAVGFGRVHVMRCHSPQYIAKYVTKQYRADNPWLKGQRMWAYVGTDKEPYNRCKDIRYFSAGITIARSLVETGFEWFHAMQIASKIETSLRAGDLETCRASSWAVYYASGLLNPSLVILDGDTARVKASPFPRRSRGRVAA